MDLSASSLTRIYGCPCRVQNIHMATAFECQAVNAPSSLKGYLAAFPILFLFIPPNFD